MATSARAAAISPPVCLFINTGRRADTVIAVAEVAISATAHGLITLILKYLYAVPIFVLFPSADEIMDSYLKWSK